MTDDCPHCAGEGTVWTPAPGSAFETARTCHRCAGTGQVEYCAECGRICPGGTLCRNCKENE